MNLFSFFLFLTTAILSLITTLPRTYRKQQINGGACKWAVIGKTAVEHGTPIFHPVTEHFSCFPNINPYKQRAGGENFFFSMYFLRNLSWGINWFFFLYTGQDCRFFFFFWAVIMIMKTRQDKHLKFLIKTTEDVVWFSIKVKVILKQPRRIIYLPTYHHCN